MATKLPQLTIRYDEQKHCLVASPSDGNRARTGGSRRPFCVEWPIEELRKHPDLGEGVVGAAVLAYFSQVSKGKVVLKEYSTEADADENALVGELELSAKNRNSSAQYSLAVLLLRRAAKRKASQDVKDAEKWLRAAAKNGSRDALTYLKESWPRAKKAVTDRIKLK